MPPYYNPTPEQLNHWQRHARSAFPTLCQPRAANSHKGSHGTLALVGGCAGMSGALVLAGSAALKSGCGKVWAGFMQTALPLPVLPQQPEIMLATAADLAEALGELLSPDRAAKLAQAAWTVASEGVEVTARAHLLLRQMMGED